MINRGKKKRKRRLTAFLLEASSSLLDCSETLFCSRKRPLDARMSCR